MQARHASKGKHQRPAPAENAQQLAGRARLLRTNYASSSAHCASCNTRTQASTCAEPNWRLHSSHQKDCGSASLEASLSESSSLDEPVLCEDADDEASSLTSPPPLGQKRLRRAARRLVRPSCRWPFGKVGSSCSILDRSWACSGVQGLVDTRRHTRKACKQRRVYEPTRGSWACSGKSCLQSRFDRACAWSSMLIPKPQTLNCSLVSSAVSVRQGLCLVKYACLSRVPRASVHRSDPLN